MIYIPLPLTFWLQFLSNAAYSVKNYGTKNMVGGGGGCCSYDLAPPLFNTLRGPCFGGNPFCLIMFHAMLANHP